jgi:hypothetical protein
MLLEDFVTLTNLDAVYLLSKSTNKHAMACILARFSLLMLGADALTPVIVEGVWGKDDFVCQHLGGTRGDLAIIRRRLILLACMANNAFHLWFNISFKERKIITPKARQHVPQGVCNTLLLVKDNTSVVYVCKPLPSSKDCIHKLQHNLRQHRLSPISSTFYTTLRTHLTISTMTFSLRASTPPTPLGRKITSLRLMASPPSTTMHKPPYLPCTTSLFCFWVLF